MLSTWSHRSKVSDKILILGELSLILASGHIGYLLCSSFSFATLLPAEWQLIYVVVFACSTMLCSLSLGLYDQKLRETHTGIIKRVLLTQCFNLLLLTVVVFNLSPAMDPGFATLIVTSIIAVILVSGYRAFFRYHDISQLSRRRVLVLGSGERAAIIEKRMRRNVDRRYFELVGFVKIAGDKEGFIPAEKQVALPDLSELFDFSERNKIDQLVIACDERRNMLPVDLLFKCKTRGIDVTDILDFIESETGQIAVNLIYPSWVIYSNGLSLSQRFRTNLDYRLNVLLALITLALTWPLMLLTALCIYFEDGRKTGAPIFYRQTRVGFDGKPFQIIKFRSMRQDAEKNGAQWAVSNDDRVTQVGRIIRKYRIDELPQLFNVLKGEMGFVGPRPERPEFVTQLAKDIPYYSQRHNVRPGLTGWAQLKYPYGASAEDALEKLKFDLYYIKHRSLLLDLTILIRTVEIVIFGKGR
ncbi:TIGR03013 family XrtA/PEP-CTERM system glycosyltransferase [Alishewanella jeotgali]|uniref:Sugar transferase domain-containing protein n=1 Tax=Alishewanella jeotgali KCTC 22429 TaxID=1129374 RepID=H3ZB72_9ALTE|nr:TIGR03013 family XrtA/PEP-CTERM system glycosyltransferase [Alishewanella jeotgali]EHR42186.1 sugar transferase domain-containing protein [Alishewanella jeotgali KCTC 22429]